jgi:hypothetical protein
VPRREGGENKNKIRSVLKIQLGEETNALHGVELGEVNPAVLRAKMKIQNISPPGSGPESAQTHRFSQDMTVRTLLRDPGGGRAKNKITNPLKHN